MGAVARANVLSNVSLEHASRLALELDLDLSAADSWITLEQMMEG